MEQIPEFRYEHTALNVPDIGASGEWYCRNLNMTVLRSGESVRFLADATGRLMFELYTNPAAEIPDYGKMHPLTLHLAFNVDDVRSAVEKLTAAGATVYGACEQTESGDEMAMLRDPWGIPLQLMKRAEPIA